MEQDREQDAEGGNALRRRLESLEAAYRHLAEELQKVQMELLEMKIREIQKGSVGMELPEDKGSDGVAPPMGVRGPN